MIEANRHSTDVLPPREVFPMWRRAQLAAGHLAREPAPSPFLLRTTGLLRPELAAWVTRWYTGAPPAAPGAVRDAYRALARDTARLFDCIRHDLGVRVRYVRSAHEPYAGAAELCADLREFGSITLRTAAADAPHPRFGGAEGGVLDQLRVVHDVRRRAAAGAARGLRRPAPVVPDRTGAVARGGARLVISAAAAWPRARPRGAARGCGARTRRSARR